MNNFLQSLRDAQRELHQRNVFPKEDKFMLPPDLHDPGDLQLAKTLTAVNVTDNDRLVEQSAAYKRDIDDLMRRLKDRKKSLKDNDEKVKALDDPKELIIRITKDFEKIRKQLPIAHIELKDPAVMIFTTDLIKDGRKVIGIYRIWIDFAKSDYRSAIIVKNVYKKAGSAYDHPCIDRGQICVGNAGNTFRRYFQERDVFELINSIVEFLISPHVGAGYISSWDAWLEQASKLNDTQEITNIYGLSPNYNDRITDVRRRLSTPEEASVPETDHIPF